MLIRKEALDIVTHCIAVDDPRYTIGGMLVLPDGSTVATDGHRLVRFTPASTGDGATDFPTTGMGAFTAADSDTVLKPFILPKAAAVQIRKAVPKKACVPVLGMVALDVAETNANGVAAFGVQDLENPQVFRPTKAEGDFPKYENVIPKSEPDAWFTVSARYLREACALLEKQHPSGRSATVVRIELRKATEDRHGKKAGEWCVVPVVLKAKSDAGETVVVIMPLHA